MLAPPVNRAMKVLDRSFFRKIIPTSAARVFNIQDIARCRTELNKSAEELHARIPPVVADPDEARSAKGGKCVLLRPDVMHDGTSHAPPLTCSMSGLSLIGPLYLEWMPFDAEECGC